MDEDYIPQSFEEAVNLIAANLKQSDFEYARANESSSVHHFTGMQIRNKWGLWEPDSAIVKDFKTRFNLFGHGDDVSGMLLHCVWNVANGKPWYTNATDVADRYRKHWVKYKVDPVTGEQNNT